jgi:hypothetical protein
MSWVRSEITGVPGGKGLSLASASRPMKRTPVSRAACRSAAASPRNIEIGANDGGDLLRQRFVHLGEPAGEDRSDK